MPNIERGIELLRLCQDLQSEKDGIARPVPGSFSFGTLDPFAQDIQDAIINMAQLPNLLAEHEALSVIGRKLASEGKISLAVGDSFSEAALSYFARCVDT